MIYVLTVKQLSDKLNVSKQTINNNVPNDMSYKKIKGINYIDSELEIAITNNIEKNKNRFSYDKNTKQSETTTTNGAASSNNELIKLLREQLEDKDKQLEEWKTQTKDFSNKLAYQQKLVDQQQQLSIDQTAKISKLENELANKNKQLIELKNDNTENKNSNISEATYSVHSDTDINNNTEPKKKGLLSRLFNR
jgi:predicted RNase H-like nuclease (RuvC/YqgF family)